MTEADEMAERRAGYEKLVAKRLRQPPRPPATWLGSGGLYMLLDEAAGRRPERFVFVDLPSPLEDWPEWARTDIGWRMRPLARPEVP